MSHQLPDARTAVETNMQYGYEKFEANRRFQERTDIAERIGYPIRTLIPYELYDGGLYARTDTEYVRFSERTYRAMREAPYLFTGDQAFEVTRRQHEHEEALQVEAFARGELDGNVFVKVSKVPDAIVADETSIKGYKRDTLRTFVRVYSRDGDGDLECRLFSLDYNDQDGLRAVEGILGMDLTSRSSEDILADHMLFQTDGVPSEFSEKLIDDITHGYDDAIFARTGEVRHAGSLFDNSVDAQRAVDQQTYFMIKHYKAIDAIVGMALNPSAKNDLLGKERERTAAAIALVLGGRRIESISELDISAEVATGKYDGDCALPTENAMEQGQTGEKEMTCPYCGFKTVGDPCAAVLECNECEALVINSVLISKGIGRAAVLKRKSLQAETQRSRSESTNQTIESSRKITKEMLVKQAYGRSAVLRTVSRVGGADFVILDNRGDVLENDSRKIRNLLK